jgi:hypothetical protein
MRFGVVTSADGSLQDWESSCLSQLEIDGCVREWTVDGRAASWPSIVDFVISFSGGLKPVDASADPQFGVWSFDVDAGGPLGWGAVVEEKTSVRARLLASRSGGVHVLLQEGMLPVAVSYRRTRDVLGQILARWPARAVADVLSGGWAHMARCEPVAIKQATSPTYGAAVRLFLGQPGRLLRRWWSVANGHDIWNVGVATLHHPLKDVRELEQLTAVRWLPPRDARLFVADPFPYRHRGREWLLCEEGSHAAGVPGRICRIDPANESSAAGAEIVIARASHLSYPYVFTSDAGVCCVPETLQERDGCIIYQLDDDEWRPLHHILRGRPIADPTILQHDGRWWLFCSNEEHHGNLTLEAYSADTLAGPWTPHPLNPLKSDLSSARPAGRPFVIKRRLFRPAQDCSNHYGGAVEIMEVTELTPSRFREVRALRLEPDRTGPYPDGLHHLVIDGEKVYLDGKKRQPDRWRWLRG